MGQGGVEAKFAVQGHGQNRIKLFRWGPPFLRPGCMLEIQAVTKEPNCENENKHVDHEKSIGASALSGFTGRFVNS